MATYRYTARDADGKEVVGDIEAPDVEEARRLLRERGLDALDVSPIATGASAGGRAERLSSEEAEQLTQHVAQLSAANLPLAPGLRAAAEECGNPRVASALRSIAKGTEQGQSLEEVLAGADALFPRYISGLVLAAARTGRLGDALSELVEHQRASRALRQSILAALAYPLLVVCLAMVVLLSTIIYIAGSYEEMFGEFHELPWSSELLFWWRDTGLWLAAGGVAVGLLAAAIVRLRVGRAGWQRLIAATPIFGPLSRWSSVAEWSGLLGLLLEHHIPLPEALRLAADGVRNANIGQLSLRLAEGAEKGRSMSQMLSATPQVPASLIPLVRWGEKAGALADALGAGREMFEKRVRTRSWLLKSILPPVLFIAIGSCILFVVSGLFAPLGSMVQGLSN